MRRFIVILSFSLFSIKGFSTFQVEDYVIINNDTLYFNKVQGYINSPLEQIDGVSERIKNQNINSSECWRGFYAEWKIINNTLYLSKVFDCFTHEIINRKVEKVLGRKFSNGLLEADWVNGNFSCGKDLMLRLYTSEYKHNVKLQIENGKIINEEYYQEENPFEIVVSESNDENEEDYHINYIEEQAFFEGKPAEIGFPEYVYKNLNYPQEYAETTIVGRVFVEFVVEKDGTISNAKIIRSLDQLLDAEVLRVINSSPKWTPANLRGEPVKVRYVFPVIFR